MLRDVIGKGWWGGGRWAHTSAMEDDAPNCPRCLVRLEIAGTDEHPYLMCPSCRVAYLSHVIIA